MRIQRRERGRVAAFLEGRIGFLEIARLVEDALAAVDGSSARDLRELVEADAERAALRREGSQRREQRSTSAYVRQDGCMSIFIAILGLAMLILIHEAGHFVASLAVGLRPRKFYVGFPPALVKTRRRGIEYGIGTIPLGGFVSIPGCTARFRTMRSGGSPAPSPRFRPWPARSTV